MASVDRLTRAVKDAQKRPENRRCADCLEKAPNYCQIEYRTFICGNCAAVHRELFGPSKIKSVGMAEFTTDEVKAMRAGGNEVARRKWMAGWTPSDMEEPPAGSHRGEIKLFLEEKYVRERWTSARAAPAAVVEKVEPPPRPAPAATPEPPVPAPAKPKIQINVKGVHSGSGAHRLAPPARALGGLKLSAPVVAAKETKEEPAEDLFAVPEATAPDPFAAAPPTPPTDDLFAAVAEPSSSTNPFAAAPTNPFAEGVPAQLPPQPVDAFADVAQPQNSFPTSPPASAFPPTPQQPQQTFFQQATSPPAQQQQQQAFFAQPQQQFFPQTSAQVGGTPQALPSTTTTSQFSANEVAILEGATKLERVTVTAAFGPRATVKDRAGTQKEVDVQSLVKLQTPATFGPNDRAFYEMGARVERCSIVEVHQDAPDEPPYYTVKLSSGKQRTTDAPHLHKPATHATPPKPMSPPRGGGDDPFSDLVGQGTGFSVGSSSSSKIGDVFVADERVNYAVKGSSAGPEAAQILKVHYDAGGQPYYTIRLLATGVERETGPNRLTKSATSPAQHAATSPGQQRTAASPGQQQQQQPMPYGGGYAYAQQPFSPQQQAFAQQQRQAFAAQQQMQWPQQYPPHMQQYPPGQMQPQMPGQMPGQPNYGGPRYPGSF